MDLGPLRALVLSLNQGAHGVPVTVTRPAPHNTPVAATGIWVVAPEGAAAPFGVELKRRDPRRIMALSRAEVAEVERGSLVSAPDTPTGAAVSYRVDGLADSLHADHWRVFLVRTS